MYARAATFPLPQERLEESLRTFLDQMRPLLREQPGFGGGYVLVDRPRAMALAISLWDSPEALERSGEAMTERRTQAMEQMGAGTPTTGRYEVGFIEGEPSGRYARVTTGEGMTGSHEAGLRYVREQVVPAVKAAPGFRGMLHLVDREGGRVLGVAFLDSEDALRQSAEQAGRLRAGAERAGIGGARSAAEYEVVEQLQPALS